MDFDWPADLVALRDRVRAFVSEHVLPLECFYRDVRAFASATAPPRSTGWSSPGMY